MALTAATTRDRRETGDIIEPGVAANAVIYQGGLVCYDGDGYVVPAAATAGYSPCIGVSQEDVDNTGGADGALRCRIYRGIYIFTDGASPAALTVANNGDFCYASDDETVNQSNVGNRPIAGIIEDVTTAGVWVRVDNRLASGVTDPDVAGGGPVYLARGASTANVAALATFTVANDGITLVEGDRILLKNQATAAENGIYVVGTVAGGLAPLTRATDADGADQVVAGMTVLVSEGTAGLDTAWHLDTNDPITVDTTALTFTQRLFGFGAAGVIANVDGAAAAAGVQTTAARADHKHSLPAAVAPTDVDGAAAIAGVSDNVARQDHKHSLPAAVAPADVDGAAAVAGVSDNVARQDHKHSLPAAVAPADIDSGAAVAGVSDNVARADHKHDISATSGLIIQSRTYQFTNADLTTAGLTQTINLGAVIPANARLVAWDYNLVDAFDSPGGATLDVQLGDTVTDDDSICSAFDAYTASANEGVPGGGTEGVGSHGLNISGQQLAALFTSTVDNLNTFTNGDLTITVLFSVLA